MDFTDLQVFKAVVDEGGISPAAKKLHRVQSNVTTRIQQLEASLGAKLFVRKKRRLHLSPAGELFLGYTEQMLRMSEQARAAVVSHVPRGVLRVGTLESTAASRLPSLLSHYHKRYPDVRVELTTGTTDALVTAVSTRKLEAAFVADCVSTAFLQTAPAFHEELVLIAPPSHPKIRSAGDVQADTIIAFPSGCAYRRRLQAWLGVDRIVSEKVLELSSYHAIVACVASGTGIAFVPRSVVATIKAGRNVSLHTLPAKIARTTTSVVWRKGESSAALNVLRNEVATLGKGVRAASDR